MTWPSLREIQNAFMPAKEIDDAARFAGRVDQVAQGYEALLSEGTHIAIIGNRGIGKTSLARQLGNVATGDTAILQKLNIGPIEDIDMQAFYLACGKTTVDHVHLLEKLISSHDCLAPWVYDVVSARKALEGYTPKFSTGFITLGGQKTDETLTAPAHATTDIETVFTNVVSAIAKERLAEHGMLIVVDEFDQIQNPAGFASFIKALATNVPSVRFCIVGVSHDIRALLHEHGSVDRLFAGAIVPMPPMAPDELVQIVDIAEASIRRAITFDESARVHLVRLAGGHPYMVHLVGKYALRQAFQARREVISETQIREALVGIAEAGTDPVLEGRYKNAVKASQQREAVLRTLALCREGEDGEILTTHAYKMALDVDVDNSSQYVGQLVTDDFGAEIEKVRERYYRFKDSLFATYVIARPPLFPRNRDLPDIPMFSLQEA